MARMLVEAGTQDLGTGTYTIMTQIAADASACAPSQVTFRLGDTGLSGDAGFRRIANRGQHRFGGGSGGQALREKLMQLAIGDAARRCIAQRVAT